MRTPPISTAFLLLATAACGDLTSIQEPPRLPTGSIQTPTAHAAPPSAPILQQRATGRGRARIVLSTSRIGGRDVALADRDADVDLVSDSGRLYAIVADSALSPLRGSAEAAGRLSPEASSASLQYASTSGGAILVQISDGDGLAVYPTTDGSYSELVNGALVTHRAIGTSLTSTSPSWQIRHFTNGTLSSSAEFLWTRITGGWRLDRIRVRSYSPSGSLVTDAVLKVATMTMMVGAPWEPRAQPRPEWRLGNGMATFASAVQGSWSRVCEVAEGLFQPAPLHAQVACATELRRQIIALIGLGASAAMGNPLTFFASAAGAINATYDWAACMEKNRKR